MLGSMGNTQKNGSHLEACVTLGNMVQTWTKLIIRRKVGSTWKNGSQLNKRVTLSKNGLHLEKWVTLGKIGHILKNR